MTRARAGAGRNISSAARRDNNMRTRAAPLPGAGRRADDEPARRMKAMAADSIGVEVGGVSKRYAHRVKGEIYAARDVVLNVRPGEFLTLLGPSGCGKT